MKTIRKIADRCKEDSKDYFKMLNEAVMYFGTNDIVTIMLSQRLDKIVVEKQLKISTKEKEPCNKVPPMSYGIALRDSIIVHKGGFVNESIINI